ncbi:MAG TPA: STAS domain-containing protein [Candidatus Micrarchaeaceae archaeon]|nr:STAS domain-containing protein [Candidatus Micrarchaeaceae archaeon]
MAERAEDDVLYADKQVVISRTDAPAGLSACGAIDVFNADAFAQILAAGLDGEGDLSIDLHSLEFCDVSGIRALVTAAKGLNDGRRMVVHGLPAQLRNVMTLVGWSDLPGLVIHDGDKTC